MSVYQSAQDTPRKPDEALPAGWASQVSRSTGRVYYYDKVNNTTQWERPIHSAQPSHLPPGSFPQKVSFSSPEATPRLAHPGMGGVEEPYEEGALWKGPLEEDETTETESTEEGTSLSPLERRASGRVQKVLLQAQQRRIAGISEELEREEVDKGGAACKYLSPAQSEGAVRARQLRGRGRTKSDLTTEIEQAELRLLRAQRISEADEDDEESGTSPTVSGPENFEEELREALLVQMKGLEAILLRRWCLNTFDAG